jgi:Tol biopolymer transport system component/predicted Ser/Thr protein kinase
VPPPSLAPGTRLGPYEVVSPIGAGGMGEVYRARDPRLNRDVALKILPADVAADPSRRRRFEVEARAVAALNHPNIVAVYDVGEGFIVSELVEGEPLRGARFGLRKTLDIAAQIASGLAAAHAAGVVHRDLKPANILLTRDGRAKILDFGLARMTQPSEPSDRTMSAALTGPGVIMGTVAYMSPEQVRGLDTDPRSDIFSFGVVLHELLGGARPFEGETAVDTLQAILREDAPDLPSTVPAGVRQVVSHCLEKDPANRFQSARDLSFALRALAQGDSSIGSAPAVESPAPPAPRSRARLWAGVALLAIAASALVTRQLTRAPAPASWSAEQLGGPAVALHPRRSPDGRLLAFQAMVDGTTQVGVMDPESGNWNVLTSRRDLGIVEYLCWSPDGSKIYFNRTLDVSTGVFSVPFLGGEERLVIENAASPAALPDGSLLVSRRNDEGRSQLTRVWPDTGRMQALPVDVTFDPGFRPWIRVSADGRRVVVALGRMYDTPGKRSLIEVDVAAGTARPIEVEGNPEIPAVALSADGASAIAAVPANALTRIVRIPLDGPRVPQDLFTVTGDVWDLDVAASGAVDVNVADRPGEVVRFASDGTKIATLARFPRAILSKMAVALPDGRDVVDARVSGRMRLMVMAQDKSPEPLLKTQEESAAPMTAVAGNRIAFAIGPEPRETIALADTATGRVSGRISPGKGVIQTLAASADGETLYFTAGGAVWSVGTAGGEPRRICPGQWVLVHPSGGLIVARNDGTRVRLFEVSAESGTESAIAVDPGARFFSMGGVRADGLLAASLNQVDSWWLQLALVDLTSGRTTRLPGDGVSEVVWATWTPDGQILALKLGMNASIWTFTRNRQ